MLENNFMEDINEEPILEQLRYSVDTEPACTFVELVEANAESWDSHDVLKLLSLKIGETWIHGMGADIQRLPDIIDEQ